MRNLISAIALALLACASSVTFAGNFAECILDKMPGSMNQATTTAVHVTCTKKYPEQFFDIKKGSGRGLFGLLGFSDPESCTIKKSRETSHVYAANQIAVACRCLYGEPEFDEEACAYRPLVWSPPAYLEPAPAKAAETTVARSAPIAVAPPPLSPAELRKIKASDESYMRKKQQDEAKVQADVKRIADRAMADYPYLSTPAGKDVLNRIMERRDQLIQNGVYPSIALTRAVNDFAPAYAPR